MLPILMYHGIPARPPVVGDPLRVPLDEFRFQVTTLIAEGWQLLGLTEALAAVADDPDRRVVGLTFDDGYEDFLGAAAVMAELGARSTLYVPTDRIGEPGYLSWDELSDVAARGVEIGSHSRRHRPMDTLRDSELVDEVAGSRAELMERLGVAVESFCYPHGYSSRRVRRAVAGAGYRNACVVGRRIARSTDDPYAVPRVQAVPGLRPNEVVSLVLGGEPGALPVIKRAAQPAWRWTRMASTRLLNRELT